MKLLRANETAKGSPLYVLRTHKFMSLDLNFLNSKYFQHLPGTPYTNFLPA